MRFKILNTRFLILVTFTIISFVSCNNTNTCYDEVLYLKHKDDVCTTDCPGVTGCDGKTYCNECEAERQGIRVK